MSAVPIHGGDSGETASKLKAGDFGDDMKLEKTAGTLFATELQCIDGWTLALPNVGE